ncbi:sensor histidine kinase [Spongiactinospora sp. 9N601]|uniref:sensor histidine kinase n=1 Tax=Spongiactinospora sp. 9N601 TaxID=3375149 RepID=UPI00379BADED
MLRRLRSTKDRLPALAAPILAALVTGVAGPAPPDTPRLDRLVLRIPKPLRRFVPHDVAKVALVAEQAFVLVLFWFAQDQVQTVNRFFISDPDADRPYLDPLATLFIAAVWSLPLALRRTRPLAAWRVMVVMLPFASLLVRPILGNPPYSMATAITYLACVYTAAARTDRETSIGIGVVSAIVAWGMDPGSLMLVVPLVAMAATLGNSARVRRSTASRLAVQERRADRADAARAVLAERSRIARELHDVVAHHMSVIAIQAEAVPMQAAGDARRLEEGLAQIRGLSLTALAEMRRVLGVLRDEDGRIDTAPQPGLDRLEELITTARGTGLTVSLSLDVPDGDVPAAVGVSAYRIVQESLSNGMRHAPGSAMVVDVHRAGRDLRLRVVNGPGVKDAAPPSPDGHGLIGMRERATMLGGTFEAGPITGGGFAVTVTLPIEKEHWPSAS